MSVLIFITVGFIFLLIYISDLYLMQVMVTITLLNSRYLFL